MSNLDRMNARRNDANAFILVYLWHKTMLFNKKWNKLKILWLRNNKSQKIIVKERLINEKSLTCTFARTQRSARHLHVVSFPRELLFILHLKLEIRNRCTYIRANKGYVIKFFLLKMRCNSKTRQKTKNEKQKPNTKKFS